MRYISCTSTYSGHTIHFQVSVSFIVVGTTLSEQFAHFASVQTQSLGIFLTFVLWIRYHQTTRLHSFISIQLSVLNLLRHFGTTRIARSIFRLTVHLLVFYFVQYKRYTSATRFHSFIASRLLTTLPLGVITRSARDISSAMLR